MLTPTDLARCVQRLAFQVHWCSAPRDRAHRYYGCGVGEDATIGKSEGADNDNLYAPPATGERPWPVHHDDVRILDRYAVSYVSCFTQLVV
jgi:hypothetical protein